MGSERDRPSGLALGVLALALAPSLALAQPSPPPAQDPAAAPASPPAVPPPLPDRPATTAPMPPPANAPAPPQAPVPADATTAAPPPPATPPAPASAASTTPAAAPATAPEVKPPPRNFALAFEVGYGWTGASASAFGDGYGRTLRLSAGAFELRAFESYALSDPSETLEASRIYGTLAMTSVGYRMNAALGPIALRPLIGVAWVRRSVLIRENDGLLAPERSTQHGAGVLLGGGVELSLHRVSIGADLRVYPTLWTGVAPPGLDDSAYTLGVVREGQLVFEPIMDKPAGMPRTVSTWLAVHW